MKRIFNRKPVVLALWAAMAVPIAAQATPSADSPYATDPQNSYVQDQTSEGLSNLNTVLCIMNAIKPADMVNKGNYIALVDMNKCDSSHQTSTSDSTAGSSGATSTPNYMTAVVNVTRASNSDPMIGKMWMSMTQEGMQQKVFVHLTATQSPTDAPPYGVFRVDYLGEDASSGVTGFNGFVDANGTNISSLDMSSHGGGSSNNAFVLNAPDDSSGSGTMQVTDYSGGSPTPVTFNFAYDSDETANGFPKGVFHRSDGTHEACFNRAKSASHKSVWRYGTYKDSDGSRVDQANPGFPIQASDGSNTYWGYASYWGVNFQGLDVVGQPDGQITGVTITDQRPGNTTTYNMFKNSGKLTKWTQQQSTLADMKGIPFTFWGDLSGQTDDATNTVDSAGFASWEMHWDDTLGKFVVAGTQVCNGGPCTVNALATPATVTGTIFDNMPISGWSNSFGGNINIPPHSGGGAHASGDEVDFYTQSDVLPGSASAPADLYCLNNCPTSASVAAFTGSNSPYDSSTASQWGSGTTVVHYSFGNSGLQEGGNSLAVTDPSLFTGQWQWGIQSGRLFSSAPSNGNCPGGTPGGTVCEDPNPTSYYTWQTGANQWNQSIWLTKTSDDSVVSFDPPETVSYTVPNDSTTYGTWAGKKLQLQFNGFGNLQGLPGACVDPQDNSIVDCGPGTRYVPAFSIADGETMTLKHADGSTTALIVKALDAEMRLDKVDCGTVSAALPASPLTLPTAAEAHDPSDASDAYYIGAEPTVTDPPKYIDGALQE